MQIPVFYSAKALGVKVIAIDPINYSIGSSLADNFYICDLADFEAIISIAKENAVDGVLTASADYPVQSVAEVAKQLNLPGLNPISAQNSTNKAKMRLALERAGIPVPKWKVVSTCNQAQEAVHTIETPVIFKPVDSSGGRGVTYVDAPAIPKNIRFAFKKALSFSRSSQVIIEEFISGKEISVESMTHNNCTHIIAITDKLTTEKPFFVEIGHSQPSRLSPIESEQVKELTVAGITALEIDNSPSHTEIRSRTFRTSYC